MEEMFEEKLMCGMCKYFREGCKREDPRVQFSRPWFASKNCCGENRMICKEYEPANYCVYVKNNYPGYDEYIKNPDVQREIRNSRYMGFFIGDDEDITYNVRTDDYINGTMWDGDTFKTFEKVYYVRTPKKGFGYKLVREPLPNGVEIKEVSK